MSKIHKFLAVDYNLKNKSIKMYSEELSQIPLLQQITPALSESIMDSETILETNVKIKEDSKSLYKLKLKDQMILFYEKINLEFRLVAFITLDFSLKFQKMLLSDHNLQKKQQIPKYQLIGFRLINQKAQSIQFYIQFADLTKIWVKELSKRINQVGFTKCYKPIRKLGKGSSATVYEIIRIEDGQRFAAKVFAKDHLKNQEKRNCFMNQIEILRNMNHKNLLKLEGIFETENSYYVIMQTLKGGNLFEYLMQKRTSLKQEQIRSIMRSIMKGLAQLQKADIVHRDIKLQNVMLRQSQEIEAVIIDFGLSVYSWEDDYIYYHCGTPGYLSPEVIQSTKNQKLTPSSDVFSAGVIFHVLLTGRYLFEGKQPRTVFENNKDMKFDLNKPLYEKVDKCMLDLLRRMLAIQPSERYSASECLEHPFLKEHNQSQQAKIEISPASTNEDYHF